MNIAFMIRHTPELTYRACKNILIPKLSKSQMVGKNDHCVMVL